MSKIADECWVDPLLLLLAHSWLSLPWQLVKIRSTAEAWSSSLVSVSEASSSVSGSIWLSVRSTLGFSEGSDNRNRKGDGIQFYLTSWSLKERKFTKILTNMPDTEMVNTILLCCQRGFVRPRRFNYARKIWWGLRSSVSLNNEYRMS